MEDLQVTHQRAMDDLQAKHQQDVDELTVVHARAVDQAVQEAEAGKNGAAEYDRNLKEATTAADTANAKLKELKAMVKKQLDENAKLNTTIAELTSEVSELRTKWVAE